REKQFFKGMLFPAYFALAMIVVYGFYFMYHSAEKEILDSTLQTSLVPKCEWIDSEFKEGGESNRLGFAISLFLLSDIESACLEKEARAAFESGDMLEEANMAFALLYPEDKERFLADACLS